MTTSQEIEAALFRLPAEERWKLLHRFSDQLWADWDTQIESDLASGRLRELLDEVSAEIISNQTRPLDRILNNR